MVGERVKKYVSLQDTHASRQLCVVNTIYVYKPSTVYHSNIHT